MPPQAHARELEFALGPIPDAQHKYLNRRNYTPKQVANALTVSRYQYPRVIHRAGRPAKNACTVDMHHIVQPCTADMHHVV